MYFVSIDVILGIHDDLCQTFHNRKGILSLWQLESLCTHIQNDQYYPTIIDKIAHLFFWLVQFHIFVDANKRTALLATLIFIAGNHEKFTYIDVDKLVLFLEQLALSVATGKTSEKELPDILGQYFSY